MKLLLTSAGFTNPLIISALGELLNKPFSDSKLAFIPTAANVESGPKDWLVGDINNSFKLGFREYDIVDFSAVPQDVWFPRLQNSNVLLFGGGNTYHLANCLKQSGLDHELVQLLKTRVYVGISAGSMVLAKNLALSTSAKLYSESIDEITDDTGLGFVDFQFRPHLNSPWFPSVRKDTLTTQALKITDSIYALDDNSAIKLDNDKMQVVGSGEWLKFN